MIKDIGSNLFDYNDLIKQQTGLDLLEIGCKAADKAVTGVTKQINQTTVAIVPITAGLGKISRFSESVMEILSFIGFKTYITAQSDIAGIGEAYRQKADLIFTADDHEFIAINTHWQKVVFNYVATADAFVTALESAVTGLENKKVLVIGAGKVGQVAVNRLVQKQAKVILYDKDRTIMETNQGRFGIQVLESLTQAGNTIKLIYDASPAQNCIAESMIDEYTYVACPGVPHGLTQGALNKIEKTNFIHDNLALGVITMAIQALRD